MVTSGALQSGALAFSRSNGIGVIRLLPDDQIEHVMEFQTMSRLAQASPVNWSEFSTALLNPSHRSKRSFFAAQDGFLFGSWFSVLSHTSEDTHDERWEQAWAMPSAPHSKDNASRVWQQHKLISIAGDKLGRHSHSRHYQTPSGGYVCRRAAARIALPLAPFRFYQYGQRVVPVGKGS